MPTANKFAREIIIGVLTTLCVWVGYSVSSMGADVAVLQEQVTRVSSRVGGVDDKLDAFQQIAHQLEVRIIKLEVSK